MPEFTSLWYVMRSLPCYEGCLWFRNNDSSQRVYEFLYVLWLAEPVEESTAPAVPASISDRYTVGRMIGDGNFAVVHECVELSTGRAYALKIINKGKCRGKVSRAQWKFYYSIINIKSWYFPYLHDAVTEIPSLQLLSYVPFHLRTSSKLRIKL